MEIFRGAVKDHILPGNHKYAAQLGLEKIFGLGATLRVKSHTEPQTSIPN